jgi:4,5-dihydroxyphthalate decarboxylase
VIFRRFITEQAWDVAEMSMGKYVALIAQGDTRMTAIPVFPSRMFRHSAFYVRNGGPMRTPADLVGRRVGIPEWAQSAVIYARALLTHEYGVALADVEWVQAGVDRPGGVERVAVQTPPGVRVVVDTTDTLDAMLQDGRIDALIAAHPPASFVRGEGKTVRLIADCQAVEERYYLKTGIFPIMHTVAFRTDVLARDPTLAPRLFQAFEQARQRSVARSLDIATPRFPVPWLAVHAGRMRERFGGDFWPYGVARNRVTLEAFLGFAQEQGVCSRRVDVDELFPREFRDS